MHHCAIFTYDSAALSRLYMSVRRKMTQFLSKKKWLHTRQKNDEKIKTWGSTFIGRKMPNAPLLHASFFSSDDCQCMRARDVKITYSFNSAARALGTMVASTTLNTVRVNEKPTACATTGSQRGGSVELSSFSAECSKIIQ